MSPETVHRIAQEIRHFRGMLTCEEKWTQAQPFSQQRVENFRRVNFWRAILDEAQRKIASGEIQQIGGSE